MPTYVFIPRANSFSCATCTRFTRAIESSSSASSLACAAATRTARLALHHLDQSSLLTAGATGRVCNTRSYDSAAYDVDRRHGTHLCCGEPGGVRRIRSGVVEAAGHLRAEGAHATTPHATRTPRVRAVTSTAAAHVGLGRKSMLVLTGVTASTGDGDEDSARTASSLQQQRWGAQCHHGACVASRAQGQSQSQQARSTLDVSRDVGRVDGDGGSGKRGDVGTKGGQQAAEGHRAPQTLPNPRAYRRHPTDCHEVACAIALRNA